MQPFISFRSFISCFKLDSHCRSEISSSLSHYLELQHYLKKGFSSWIFLFKQVTQTPPPPQHQWDTAIQIQQFDRMQSWDMTKSVLWLCSQDKILIDSIEYIIANMHRVKGLKLNLKKMKMSLVCFIYPILGHFITKNEASNNGIQANFFCSSVFYLVEYLFSSQQYF